MKIRNILLYVLKDNIKIKERKKMKLKCKIGCNEFKIFKKSE